MSSESYSSLSLSGYSCPGQKRKERYNLSDLHALSESTPQGLIDKFDIHHILAFNGLLLKYNDPEVYNAAPDVNNAAYTANPFRYLGASASCQM